MRKKKKSTNKSANIEFGKRRYKYLLKLLSFMLMTIPWVLLLSPQTSQWSYNANIPLMNDAMLKIINICNLHPFYVTFSGVALYGLISAICIMRKRGAKARLRKYNNLEKMKTMTWREFEEILADYYVSKGYRVTLVGGSGGDGGIDLIIKKWFGKWIVQAKHYKNNVGVSIVREMFGVMYDQKADGVFICTTAGFTKDAQNFAKGKPIKLIPGPDLADLFSKIN